MEDYGAIIRRTFEQGSVLDAQTLFEAFLHNAFPTFHFRRPEVITFSRWEQARMEGRSWNHVFEITKVDLEGSPAWKVSRSLRMASTAQETEASSRSPSATDCCPQKSFPTRRTPWLTRLTK